MPNNTPLSPRKKLLVMLGIFALPIIVIIVIVCTLLKPPKSVTSATTAASGFNKNLPEPNLPKDTKNKLEIYMQAQADSIKLQQQKSRDPYAGDTLPTAPVTSVPSRPGLPSSKLRATSLFSAPAPGHEDANEKKVNDQLKRLYAALGTSTGTDAPEKLPPSFSSPTASLPSAAQTAQLQQLMGQLQKKDTETDPKLQQISSLLDKVLAIKNPGQSLSAGTMLTDNRKTFPVGTQPSVADSGASYIETGNGFFGLSEASDAASVSSSSIEAVIHGTQIIQSGSIVKLRLLQPIFVGDTRIPANSFIYGPATISGERVEIQLNNAIVNDHIYPVALKVYDANDGLEGLYVPGAITRDVVRQNMSQGVSSLGLATTLDQSVGAQALSAGIETTKDLLSHKIRIVKVTLKEGHLAILKAPENHH